MVYRCYTEKKKGFDVQAQLLLGELRGALGIPAGDVRILCRYDAEGLTEEGYARAKRVVFSEPPADDCYDEQPPTLEGFWTLAVEALPGQYDQRADSCAQCIQMLLGGERPTVAAATLYAVSGELSEEDKARIRTHLINPVESREASMQKPETLAQNYPAPAPVGLVQGLVFADDEDLKAIIQKYGLAMDLDDLRLMRDWFFQKEHRDPTETELKVTDTYWSDHCRHTTFNTRLDEIEIGDEAVRAAFSRYLAVREEVYGPEKAAERPKTLMDLATLATKALKKRGKLPELDESEEINACSIHVDAVVDGEKQNWLLMFKNETHNHPTEIEPFGGAATCIGGAIRDPLSGRAYVHQAMRVTGAADPTVPLEATLPGKLPQRRLTTSAAAGYSSYGNQIGLSTGLVHEFYHPGYVAKRMEVGAVVGAVKAGNIRRERPQPGDVVILLGGRTGRDGIGGATGSSKTHNMDSLTTMASEVQKGNAPEERKLQRLFRKPEVTKLIKRCNDFGAGGVSVAIGELADGLDIDLGLVRKKYEGLSGTEIAISESQERMAVVVAAEDAAQFIEFAEAENLEAYAVARVTDTGRMTMRLGGRVVADLPRAFLDTNGAPKHMRASVPALPDYAPELPQGSPAERLRAMAGDLRWCSRRGLQERFDGSIGAGSVLMPQGGAYQRTPAQAMSALLPVISGETETCSVMAFGFDPYHSEKNGYTAARDAVVTSVAKLVASGCDADKAYLSFQEYFERLGSDPSRWGKPLAALLGAFDAQMALECAAIGGKDSMSGSFMDLDVPPTLISFAIAPCEAGRVISPEFKQPGSRVYLFSALGDVQRARVLWKALGDIAADGAVYAAWAVTDGGPIEGIFKMALGNGVGFETAEGLDPEVLFTAHAGDIVVECRDAVFGAVELGKTIEYPELRLFQETVTLDELLDRWEKPLESVFPTRTADSGAVEKISSAKPNVLVARESFAAPRVVIPVFPGTNCEYDTARAVSRAGGVPEIVVVRNLSAADLTDSVERLTAAIRNSQIVVLPGGFSGGDEPDGSGKFIASFLRSASVRDAVHELLKERDGLMLGICNGFQALIKLGLVPYGEIRDMDEGCPTLTFNRIGRHQSRYVTTRISSVASPWLRLCEVGQLHSVPISHGEGRFVCPEPLLGQLIENGQIATQYADAEGNPSMDIDVCPNGSVMAIEGILSPDGRVLGKMGHTERRGRFVAENVPGDKHQPIFEAGVGYFK